jgi:DNA-binding response OmpR family regulator
MTDDPTTVLVVEDEERLADLYAKILADEYEVQTANSGETAMDIVDESVDVVLLDRKMPGLSGRDVLERLRAEGYDCPVAMLTAVTPDWDILDMGFDDYLNKPAESSELHRLVERLVVLGSLDDEVRTYIARSVKQAAIEGQKDPSELDANSDFEELVDKTAETSADLGDITAELSQRETELVLETITRSLGSVSDDSDDGLVL